MYVLTISIHDYLQYGNYFVAAWRNKPSKEELLKFEGIDENVANTLLQLGTNSHDQYDNDFDLEKVEEGKDYFR